MYGCVRTYFLSKIKLMVIVYLLTLIHTHNILVDVYAIFLNEYVHASKYVRIHTFSKVQCGVPVWAMTVMFQYNHEIMNVLGRFMKADEEERLKKENKFTDLALS